MKTVRCILGIMLAGSALAADITAISSPKSAMITTSSKPVKSFAMTGPVLSVDMVGNTLTVEGKKKTPLIFSVPATAKILEGKKVIVLGDIAIGFKVAVRYTKDGDTLSASSIRVWPVKKASEKSQTK